jgi:methylmalonyl-CoA mutase cobalamin-binding domain/chain
MRRILQASGAEVIHLGHNRSVADVVAAAIQEDAQAVAISSYQGGHVEYFRYLRRSLDAQARRHIRVFGGGGGVIVPEEIEALQAEGSVDRIYSPEDGRRMGLQGLIDDLLPAPTSTRWRWARRPPPRCCRRRRARRRWRGTSPRRGRGRRPRRLPDALREAITDAAAARPAPVVGITGTGGAGQVLAHRRADAPLAARPPHRPRGRPVGRPHPQAHRRRAAGRPHPHERPRSRAGVHAQPRHPRPQGRAERRHPRRGGRLPGSPASRSSRRDLAASARATPTSPTSPTARST